VLGPRDCSLRSFRRRVSLEQGNILALDVGPGTLRVVSLDLNGVSVGWNIGHWSEADRIDALMSRAPSAGEFQPVALQEVHHEVFEPLRSECVESSEQGRLQVEGVGFPFRP
jgi:hypothetical protein